MTSHSPRPRLQAPGVHEYLTYFFWHSSFVENGFVLVFCLASRSPDTDMLPTRLSRGRYQ